MKKQVQSFISKLLIIPILAFGAGLLITASASAQDCEVDLENPFKSAECAHNPNTPGSLTGEDGAITTITNVLLFIVGAVSVIMIIYGGIQYATSSGDSSRVQNAKNTILYAIVGLIVSILAYAIVNFVLDAFIS